LAQGFILHFQLDLMDLKLVDQALGLFTSQRSGLCLPLQCFFGAAAQNIPVVGAVRLVLCAVLALLIPMG
jgi:hypothetical protein